MKRKRKEERHADKSCSLGFAKGELKERNVEHGEIPALLRECNAPRDWSRPKAIIAGCELMEN